jgi:hypothetical protein
MVIAFARERSEWEKVADRPDEGPLLGQLPMPANGAKSPHPRFADPLPSCFALLREARARAIISKGFASLELD